MIGIRLARGSPGEERTRDQLIAILGRYDMESWIFTDDVVVEENGWPHSHPVLTIDVSDDADMLLATFVHEQLHWFEETRTGPRDRAIRDTATAYPVVPTERPEGAGSEESTRLHLLVCLLEHLVLEQIVGVAAARRIVERLSEHHYRWIYRTVLSDRAVLGEILVRHDLLPPGLAAPS